MKPAILLSPTLLTLVLCSLLFANCTTTPKGPDELDIAIRDTSDYLNDNIPKGSKIVILNIQSDYAALSEYIIDELIANAVNDKVFSVVDRAQLETIRMELNFQISGEVDDDSALSIGKFLGAQTIVSGAISEIADRYRMRIRALNVQTAEVQGQYNRNITASQTITALMKGGKTTNANYAGRSGAVNSGTGGTTVSQASTGSSPQTTAPAQAQTPNLKNGTYTLTPRPRARHEGGKWEDFYISKVEVESGFITFYFEDSSTSRLGYSSNVNSSRWSREVILTNIDKPNVFQKNSGWTHPGNSNYVESLIFPRIDSSRLKMEATAYEHIIFSEITLGEPDE